MTLIPFLTLLYAQGAHIVFSVHSSYKLNADTFLVSPNMSKHSVKPIKQIPKCYFLHSISELMTAFKWIRAQNAPLPPY